MNVPNDLTEAPSPYPQEHLSPHDEEIIAAAKSECPETTTYSDGEVWAPESWVVSWLWEHRRPQPFGFAPVKIEGHMFLPDDYYLPE